MPLGFGVGLVSTNQIADSAITNAKVAAAAAIAMSKLNLAITMSEIAAAVKNAANGLVVLDASARVPNAQLSLFSAFADVTGARAINTVYQNTSGRLMLVSVVLSGTQVMDAYSDAANPPTTVVAETFPANTTYSNLLFLVQPGHYYKLANVDTIQKWYEWS